MEKEFVPVELALRMKAIGFDEPCFGHYQQEYHDDGMTELEPSLQMIISKQHQHAYQVCTAPLYQQAFKWFREKYDLFPIVQPYFPSNRLTWNIIFMDNFSINVGDGDGEYVESEIIGSYEEAEIACLKKMIEIVKEKL